MEMERTDVFIKTVIGIVTGFVSYIVDGFGLVFTALLGLMLLDFISGILVALVNKSLNSGIGTFGLIKKVHIIIIIGATYLIEVSVLKSNGAITDGISAAFCVTEFISIVENAGGAGFPLPHKLKELILSLKSENKVQQGLQVGQSEQSQKDRN